MRPQNNTKYKYSRCKEKHTLSVMIGDTHALGKGAKEQAENDLCDVNMQAHSMEFVFCLTLNKSF